MSVFKRMEEVYKSSWESNWTFMRKIPMQIKSQLNCKFIIKNCPQIKITFFHYFYLNFKWIFYHSIKFTKFYGRLKIKRRIVVIIDCREHK